LFTYTYVGSDIDYVYNVKVDNISLWFFNNKLIAITVEFGNILQSKNFELSDYYSILSALERAYGNIWAIATKSDFIIGGAIWPAKNVTLELTRYKFETSGFIGGSIHVYDNKLMNAVYANEF
jgi:hypothetical protein